MLIWVLIVGVPLTAAHLVLQDTVFLHSQKQSKGPGRDAALRALEAFSNALIGIAIMAAWLAALGLVEHGSELDTVIWGSSTVCTVALIVGVLGVIVGLYWRFRIARQA